MRGVRPTYTTMKRILVLDIGGTTVKFYTSYGVRNSFPSGRKMTAEQMCISVLELLSKDDFDVVTIGYPGPVGEKGPLSEPELLNSGWVGYNFVTKFGKPVKVINDAAMQAIGSYRSRRTLFLGLGTGLGTCLISNYVVIPMEVANLPYTDRKSYGDFLAQRGLDRYGEEVWFQAIEDVVKLFIPAFIVEDVVLGGGNANRLKKLPLGTRKCDNSAAFDGGVLLWDENCKFSFG
jgi:polyphosphate glucokinase